MYIFIKEKKDEFLKGKKVKNVANEFEGSPTQLSSVLNGKSKTSKMYGLGLLYICDKSKKFNYYFKKIDKC